MENVKGDRVFYKVLAQGTPEWLDLRATCLVTASEVGSVIGIGYDSRAKMIKRKIGEASPTADNEYMRAGRDAEPMIAAAYEDAFKVHTESFGFATLEVDGIKVGASPDRICCTTEPPRLVEIKWSRSERTVPETAHLAQMLLQSVVFQVDTVDYVCWSPSQLDDQWNVTLQVARVQFDPRLWTDHVLPAIKEFKTMVERKITPSVNTAEKTRLLDAFEKYTRFIDF